MLLALLLPLFLLASPALTKPYFGGMGSDFSCPQPQGYYKVSNQCDEYVECKNSVPMQLSCPQGLHFNPARQWTEYPCDAPSVVRCSPPPQIYTMPAPPPRRISIPAPVKVAPREFSCPQPQGYYPKPNDCAKYIQCKNNVPTTMSCPTGLHFNPQVQWTDYPCDQPARAQCSTRAIVAAPPSPPPPPPPPPPQQLECQVPYGYFKQAGQTCGEYTECKNYVPRTQSCPSGFNFNPQASWREFPCEHHSVVQCEEPRYIPPVVMAPPPPPPPVIDYKCPKSEGYFEHPGQCGAYVECKNNIPRTYSCPAEYHFNPKAEWTGYPCAHRSRQQCKK